MVNQIISKFPLRYAPPDPGTAKQTTVASILSNLEDVSTKELLIYLLIELKTMNYYLHEGLNISDDPQKLREQCEEDIKEIIH